MTEGGLAALPSVPKVAHPQHVSLVKLTYETGNDAPVPGILTDNDHVTPFQLFEPYLWRFMIVRFMDWKTAIRLASVCRGLHRVVYCHATWYQMIGEKFGQHCAELSLLLGDCTPSTFRGWLAERTAFALAFVREVTRAQTDGPWWIAVQGGFVRDLIARRVEEFSDIDIVMSIHSEVDRAYRQHLQTIVNKLKPFHNGLEIVYDSCCTTVYPNVVCRRRVKIVGDRVPFIDVDILLGPLKRPADSTINAFQLDYLFFDFSPKNMRPLVFDISTWASQMTSSHFHTLRDDEHVPQFVQALLHRYGSDDDYLNRWRILDKRGSYNQREMVDTLSQLQARKFRLFSPVPLHDILRLKQRIARFRELDFEPDSMCLDTVAVVHYIERCPAPLTSELKLFENREVATERELPSAKRPCLSSEESK